MRALLSIFFQVWGQHKWPLFLGTFMSVTALAAGIALLGVSGWFISASALAGLVGAGFTFDVFRPSAGVRLFAFGRAAARYGERLATHDATLRGLARLRVELLRAILRQPFNALARLRGSERLNTLTIDVDALDGLALRLVIPALAAIVILFASFLILGWLVGFAIATWLALGFIAGAVLAFSLALKTTGRASRIRQRSMQALRMRFIDMMRGQAELAAAGRLEELQQGVLSAQDRLQEAQARLDMADRVSGFSLSAVTTLVAGGALLLGTLMARAGTFDAAHAALGFFAALALFEAAMPLARGAAELGGMLDAARCIIRQMNSAEVAKPKKIAPADKNASTVLTVEGLSHVHGARVLFSNIGFSVARGETLALTGASGAGKTTLLHLLRGLEPAQTGEINLFDTPVIDWPDDELAWAAGYLPQRSALVAGTIRDNLLITDPSAEDAALLEALHIAALDQVIHEKGGLDFRLGESGRGLSGGELRRLALARTILRKPALLLLDEPTEGLDSQTAKKVLECLRSYLPHSAIIIAAHKREERDWAARQIVLS